MGSDHSGRARRGAIKVDEGQRSAATKTALGIGKRLERRQSPLPPASIRVSVCWSGCPSHQRIGERCALRTGNVHSAARWRAAVEPVIVRYRGSVKHLYFRGDAAFANPEIYELLEAEQVAYTIRLPANDVLQRRIGYLLKRPVGRPPNEVRRYYASFTYQARAGASRAASWPRSSGIRASSTRASTSSSPT
jgi:hypothetical protein